MTTEAAAIVSFDWPPFYRELAPKLLPYRTRQQDLLAFLDELRAKDIPVTPNIDTDAEGNQRPLEVMDPFTFYGCFSRGISPTSRRQIMGAIKERFGLASPVPTEFHGIPILNNQKSWFFGRKFKRQPDDIERLWEVFRLALQQDPFSDPAFLKAFNRAMEVLGVSANLTFGLFWIRPEYFLNLDAAMREKFGLKDPPKRLTGETYRGIVEKVRSKYGSDFPRISYEIWTSGKSEKGALEPPEEEEVEADDSRPLVLLGTWKEASKIDIAAARSTIEKQGAWVTWWSFPIRKEFHSQLENGFYFYVNVGHATIPYRFWVEKFQTSTGSVGLESPWPTLTGPELLGKTRMGEKQSEVFKTWFNVSKIDDLSPPLSLDAFDPAPGTTRTALLNQAAFGYALLKGGVGAAGTTDKPHVVEAATPLPSDLGLNTILYGPPGTGKTYTLETEYFRHFAGSPKRYRFVTFHQSYGYEDFVEGIRPKMRDGAAEYEIRKGVLREICDAAQRDPLRLC